MSKSEGHPQRKTFTEFVAQRSVMRFKAGSAVSCGECATLLPNTLDQASAYALMQVVDQTGMDPNGALDILTAEWDGNEENVAAIPDSTDRNPTVIELGALLVASSIRTRFPEIATADRNRRMDALAISLRN